MDIWSITGYMVRSSGQIHGKSSWLMGQRGMFSLNTKPFPPLNISLPFANPISELLKDILPLTILNSCLASLPGCLHVVIWCSYGYKVKLHIWSIFLWPRADHISDVCCICALNLAIHFTGVDFCKRLCCVQNVPGIPHIWAPFCVSSPQAYL